MATEDARAGLPGHAEDVRDAADDAGKQASRIRTAHHPLFLRSLMAKVSF